MRARRFLEWLFCAARRAQVTTPQHVGVEQRKTLDEIHRYWEAPNDGANRRRIMLAKRKAKTNGADFWSAW